MKITRKSPFSGKVHTLDLPVTEEELERWAGGELIQNVFPGLTAGQREFIMTGITEREWDETFSHPAEDSERSSPFPHLEGDDDHE